jgi:mitofusin
MQKGRERFERTLEEIEDETVFRAGDRSKERLSSALSAVGRGELAPETALTAGLELPAYPGVLDLWDYARDVKLAFLQSLDEAVRLAEDDTRALTAVGVNQVGALGEKHLPEGVERPTKVFRPSAMFARGKDVRRRSGFVGAVGLQSLSSRDDLTALMIADLYDVHAQLARLSAPFTSDDKAGEAASSAVVPYTLSALGAVGLVGGKTMATRTVVETFLRLADVLRSPAARKWAAPAIALVTLSLGAWVLAELPRTVPRRVGANLAATLASEDESFVGSQADRLSGETKRVLRAAAWNLRAAFTGAMDDRLEDVRRAEASQRKAEKAAKWFDEVGRRTEAIRTEAGWVEPKLLA